MVRAMRSQLIEFSNPMSLPLVNPPDWNVPATHVFPSHFSVGKVLVSKVMMLKVGKTFSTKFLFQGQSIFNTQPMDQGSLLFDGRVKALNEPSSLSRVVESTIPFSVNFCCF